MGGCISAPPSCKNQCGRDAKEMCRGYCRVCFDRNDMHADDKPVPRPASPKAAPLQPTDQTKSSAPTISYQQTTPAAVQQPPGGAPVLSTPPVTINYTANPPVISYGAPGAAAAPMPLPSFSNPPPAYGSQNGNANPSANGFSPYGSANNNKALHPSYGSGPAHPPIVVYSPPNFGSQGGAIPSPQQPQPQYSSYGQPSPIVGPPVVQGYHSQQPSAQFMQAAPQQPLHTANVSCPQCRRPLYIPPGQAVARCPGCNAAFGMPGYGSAPPQPQQQQQQQMQFHQQQQQQQQLAYAGPGYNQGPGGPGGYGY